MALQNCAFLLIFCDIWSVGDMASRDTTLRFVCLEVRNDVEGRQAGNKGGQMNKAETVEAQERTSGRAGAVQSMERKAKHIEKVIGNHRQRWTKHEHACEHERET